MTDHANDSPLGTEALVCDVNGFAAPAGVGEGYVDVLVPANVADPHGAVCVDTSADPGAVGGNWRTDIAGQMLAVVGAGFEWAVGIEQRLSTEIFGAVAWGPHAAMRVGDWTIGIPHVHAPIAPWPPWGPVFRGIPFLPNPGQVLDMGFLSGAATVTINGMQAARCGDMGVHIPACLGFLPFFEIFFGSATVWIESQRAARTLDPSLHCTLCDAPTIPPKIAPGISVGPGSGDVFIGGVPLPSALDAAVALGVQGITAAGKRLARLSRLNRLARRFPRFRLPRWLDDEIAAWQRRMKAARTGGIAADAAPVRPGYRGPPEGFRNNKAQLHDYDAVSPTKPRGSRGNMGVFGRGGQQVELPIGHSFDEFFDQRLYDVQTNLFSSTGPPGTRPFNYIIDGDGEMWIGIGGKHSTLANGENVYGAGQMWVTGDGVIKQIDDGSGHYFPYENPEHFGQDFFDYANNLLEAKGIDTSGIHFHAFGIK